MKVAVIGIGNMGRHHARIYSELDCELVAVSDINKEGEEIAKRFNCKYYKDYNGMLKNENIDAVSIVVPTKDHKQVALDVINSGKHVLIEKPIANNVEDAKLIIEKAKEKKVILMIGHIERFNPAIIRLKGLIDNKELGEITSLVAKRVGIAPPQIKDANVIIDAAIHDIDIFNYLLNRLPNKSYCLMGKALINQREDYGELLLRYGDTSAFVQVNWITPIKIRNLSVTGTKGYAELDYIAQELKIYESKYTKEWGDFGDFIIKFGRSDGRILSIDKEEPLKLELKHFLDCIKEDKRPKITGEDGLAALEVVTEALKQGSI